MRMVTPGRLTVTDLRRIDAGFEPVSLNPGCWAAVAAGAATIEAIVAKGLPAYGINTGFGKLARVGIPADRLERLQTNLVRSHAAGVGPLLDDDTVRLILVLKIASLARGHSGVRIEVLEAAVALHNAGIWPCIPAQGSVGASGDLAPLAHLALGLAPGTGTPEPGGITTREALRMLRGFRNLNLVGADVVEVSPPFDPSGNTALVGATIMFELLCLLAEARAT